ncbi:MAG: ABC transporter permease [Lysobacterales bacterium]
MFQTLFLRVIPVMLGVTALGFTLLVKFGPDRALELAGRNPTAEEVAVIREQLHDGRPWIVQYGHYLADLLTLDLGQSDSTGEPVTELLARTVPNSIALVLPGFILGHLLALILAGTAASHRNRWPDRLVASGAMLAMSVSFVVVMMVAQIVFASRYGLGWFPARGWSTASMSQWLSFVAVPTFIIVLVSTGYNVRFYRAVLVEEMSREHVRTCQMLGYSRWRLMLLAVLPNALLPIITRLMYSIPSLVVGGSLLLESYFGIPGAGKVTFDAITNGDQPVLKAVLGLSSLLMVMVMVGTDRLYRRVDPRLTL